MSMDRDINTVNKAVRLYDNELAKGRETSQMDATRKVEDYLLKEYGTINDYGYQWCIKAFRAIQDNTSV